MFKKLTSIVVAIFCCQIALSNVKLPSILGDNMVLQQNSEVALWGLSAPDVEVVVKTSWNNKIYKVNANSHGEWKLWAKTPEAGGPYKISFEDGENKIELSHVLIGEVWICSGQSNMAMPMIGKKNQPILNSKSIISKAHNPNLHLFNVEQDFNAIPLKDVKGSWKLTNPETVANFSAVAYQFGEMLQEELNVPVGIIVSSWGGTPIRAWMNEKALKDFPSYKKKDDLADFRQPSVLYNAMLAPLTAYSIAGFLWYQGENDRKTSDIYEKALPAMVNQWKNDWNNENLPFYYVQIAPFHYKNDQGKEFAPLMREAQLNSSKKMKNAGMVVTSDIGSNKTIHPPDKTTVARRLANFALNKTYNKENFKVAEPEFKSFKIQKDNIIIDFKNSEGLTLKNNATHNFEIAGEDQKFYPAEARIKENKLIFHSTKVDKPVAARYGFRNYFEGNLFNDAGLPASSFRTDNWKIN
jgi:sialate O-acetylesterase